MDWLWPYGIIHIMGIRTLWRRLVLWLHGEVTLAEARADYQDLEKLLEAACRERPWPVLLPGSWTPPSAQHLA